MPQGTAYRNKQNKKRSGKPGRHRDLREAERAPTVAFASLNRACFQLWEERHGLYA